MPNGLKNCNLNIILRTVLGFNARSNFVAKLPLRRERREREREREKRREEKRKGKKYK